MTPEQERAEQEIDDRLLEAQLALQDCMDELEQVKSEREDWKFGSYAASREARRLEGELGSATKTIRRLMGEGMHMSANQCVHPGAITTDEGRDVFCKKEDELRKTRDMVDYKNRRIAALEQLAEMVIDPRKVGVEINNDPFVWAHALQERARELMEVKGG